MNLQQYLKQSGYTTVEDSYTALVQKWAEWYKGDVRGFHDYSIYNGTETVRMKRARLNMAKQGAEKWADLLWNNECFITVDDGTAAEDKDGNRMSGSAETALSAILERNGFTLQTNTLLEKTFALGTGAYVIYPEAGAPKLDYVDAEYIHPLSWYNGECLSCAFSGVRMEQDGRKTLTLMIHEHQEDGSYIIRNRYFSMSMDSDQLTPIDTPPDVLEEYRVGTKRFALLRPNIVNNAYNIPMGISVYGNYIDVLKCIDLAFDGIKVSMQLGRPRVALSSAAMRPTPEGSIPVFDSNDIAFYQLPESIDPTAKTLIEDITTTYRAGDFEKSLQCALTLYSVCIGLGEKAFQWESGNITTATQVISENNGMQRAMEKHQEILRSAIVTVVRAALDILGFSSDLPVMVNFDDSAVRDRDAERIRFWQYVTAGKFPFWKFLCEFEGYSKAEAIELEGEASTGMQEVL